CFLAPRARDHCCRRPELGPAAGCRQGLEGQPVAALLCRRDRVDALVAMGRAGALRARRAAVVDTGSAHRARAQAASAFVRRRKHLDRRPRDHDRRTRAERGALTWRRLGIGSGIERRELGGYAPPFSARTTASSRPPAYCSASRPPTRAKTAC